MTVNDMNMKYVTKSLKQEQTLIFRGLNPLFRGSDVFVLHLQSSGLVHTFS